MKIAAIIPAAGAGIRMGGTTPKQFLTLCSRPILVHTLAVFESWTGVDEVVAVIPEKDKGLTEEWVERYNLKKVHRIVCGGPRRQDSVYNGLREVDNDVDIVLVHDGVRPLITPGILKSCADTALRTGAAVAAVAVKDTIKEAGGGRKVIRTPDRSRLWAVQTPQGFKREILAGAMEQARKDSFTGTDEASLVERLNIPVTLVDGSYENIKITSPEDIIFAETILKARSG